MSQVMLAIVILAWLNTFNNVCLKGKLSLARNKRTKSSTVQCLTVKSNLNFDTFRLLVALKR